MKATLHVMLVVRLAIVTAVMSAVVAVVVVLDQDARVKRVALDRALIRAGTLRSMILEQLDDPGPMNPAAVEGVLKAVAYKGFDLSVGHYVLLRVMAPDGTEVARARDVAHGDLGALERHLAVSAYRPPAGRGGYGIDRVRIGKTQYMQVHGPLTNSRGKVAAYADGYFAMSPEEERERRWQLVRAGSLAVGIVVVTALLLYPVIVRLLRRLARLAEQLLESNLEVLGVLGSAIAKRDSDTDLHNFRVTIYAVRIAEAMRLDEKAIRVLIRGAFLHDVGKIGVRDAILLKPGRLTPEEFSEMNLHVNHGVDIISRSSWIGESLPVVVGHHEKVDGSGYPAGLKKGEIPLLARVFAVADVFDALTSRRPYKEPLGYDETIAILTAGRGSHFDPAVLDAFLGIAFALYERYARKESDQPRRDVDAIMHRYYKVDMADHLE